MSVTPYPLAWPTGVARTAAKDRKSSPFKTSLTTAINNVNKSLAGFQRDSVVLS